MTVASKALAVGIWTLLAESAPAEGTHRSIELLRVAQFDTKNSIGTWRLSEGCLSTVEGHRSRIAFPIAPSEPYGLSLKFRIDSGYSFGVALPLHTDMALLWVTRAHKGGKDGVYLHGLKDPARYLIRKPPSGGLTGGIKQLDVRVDWRDGSDIRIAADIDGERIMEWTGKKAELVYPAEYALPQEALALANWWTTVEFRDIVLTMPLPEGEWRGRVRATQEPGRVGPSLFTTAVAPSQGESPRLLFENEAVAFYSVGYGGGNPRVPGFYAFSKTLRSWVRLDRVSTFGARFGRTPTPHELRAAGRITPPAAGWNHLHYRDKPYVGLSLNVGGFLGIPDSFVQDRRRNEWVLEFNSSWGVEAATTVLRFSEAELRRSLRAAAQRIALEARDVLLREIERAAPAALNGTGLKRLSSAVCPSGWAAYRAELPDSPAGRVDVFLASTPTKAQRAFFVRRRSRAQRTDSPVQGLGDQAYRYGQSRWLLVRRSNVLLEFSSFQDLDEQRIASTLVGLVDRKCQIRPFAQLPGSGPALARLLEVITRSLADHLGTEMPNRLPEENSDEGWAHFTFRSENVWATLGMSLGESLSDAQSTFREVRNSIPAAGHRLGKNGDGSMEDVCDEAIFFEPHGSLVLRRSNLVILLNSLGDLEARLQTARAAMRAVDQFVDSR